MKSSLKLLSLLLPVALLAGCETDPHYIDPNGKEAVVSMSQINAQDWQMLADKLVASLLDSGALAKLPQPAIVAGDRIINNTQVQVDTAVLENKIRAALAAQGVHFTNAEGLGEQAVYANQRRTDDAAVNAFEKGESEVKTQQKMATITLGGRLTETRARSGSERQVTYTFHLSLNDIATGTVLWESEQSIAKKGSRPAIGL